MPFSRQSASSHEIWTPTWNDATDPPAQYLPLGGSLVAHSIQQNPLSLSVAPPHASISVAPSQLFIPSSYHTHNTQYDMGMNFENSFVGSDLLFPPSENALYNPDPHPLPPRSASSYPNALPRAPQQVDGFNDDCIQESASTKRPNYESHPAEPSVKKPRVEESPNTEPKANEESLGRRRSKRVVDNAQRTLNAAPAGSKAGKGKGKAGTWLWQDVETGVMLEQDGKTLA